MLAAGCRRAQFPCLRCQLRRVIFQAQQPSLSSRCRPFAPQCIVRGFKTSSRHRLDDGGDQEHLHTGGEERGVTFSKFRLHKSDREQEGQKETSRRLQSTAMGKPFDITVMRDEPERPKDDSQQQQGLGDSSSSALTRLSLPSSAGSGITALEEEPSDEEVLASIDALRPHAGELEDEEIEALASKLRKAYNTKQLSMYLKETLRFPSTNDPDSLRISPAPVRTKEGGLKRTEWQPGKTPITQRHSRGEALARSGPARSKKAIISQILRLAWKIEERQSIGELEVKLEEWQYLYLFDLHSNGQPMYQTVIDNSLLQQHIEIQAYKPDNILRVTGLRSDAAQVVHQLEQRLMNLKRLEVQEVDLRDTLRRASSPVEFATTWDETARRRIGLQTQSAIVLSRGAAVVHAATYHQLHVARSLLLSWLDLPSPTTTETFDWDALGSESSEQRRRAGYIVPLEEASSQLPLRYHGMRFGRVDFPVPRISGEQSKATEGSAVSAHFTTRSPISKLEDTAGARVLSEHLSAMGPSMPYPMPKPDALAFFEPARPLPHPPWRVEVCRLLQPASEGLDMRAVQRLPNRQAVVQPQLPHLSALLSNLPVVPTSKGRYNVVAHLRPSPFAKGLGNVLRNLPRISITYDVEEGFKPISVMAELCSEEILVPLPGEAVDLRFLRDSTVAIPLETAAPYIEQFTGSLQASAAQPGGSLEFLPSVRFKLPGWLFFPSADDADDQPTKKEKMQFAKMQKKRNKMANRLRVMEYLFDSFEYVESRTFTTKDQARYAPTQVKGARVKLASDARLRFHDIEAPDLGVRRSVLEIHSQSTAGSDLKPAAQSYREQTSKLVSSALAIARTLTDIGAGKLRARDRTGPRDATGSGWPAGTGKPLSSSGDGEQRWSTSRREG